MVATLGTSNLTRNMAMEGHENCTISIRPCMKKAAECN